MRLSWVFLKQQCYFYAYLINVLFDHVIFEHQHKQISICKIWISLKLQSLSKFNSGSPCRSWNRVPGKKSVTTTDGRTDVQRRTKTPPLILGVQFSFWSFFIDFELISNFFVALEKGFRQVFCFSGWLVETLNSQISSFESYKFLIQIQNENPLDVGIQFFVAWVCFLCSKWMISFFASIGPRSRTSQF